MAVTHKDGDPAGKDKATGAQLYWRSDGRGGWVALPNVGSTSAGGTQWRIGAGLLSDTTANTASNSADEFAKTLAAHPDWVAEAYAATHGGKTTAIGTMISSIVADTTKAQALGMTYAQYHTLPGATTPGGGDGGGAGGGGGGGGGSYYSGPSAAQINALDTIQTALYQYGLDNLGEWAYNKVMNEGNVHPADILMQMKQTQEYQQRFPGMSARAANGLPPITEADYIKLENAYSEIARNYNLPEGFMTPQEKAILIGHDVSANEFQDRVVNGYNVAMSAPKETRQLLRDYYGIHHGDLAAYYLDPTRAKNIWQKQTQAAIAGTEAMASGFGRIGRKAAGQIAAQTIGSPSNMNADYYRAQFAKIAPLKSLETAQVGMDNQATVSKQQLLGTAFAGAIKGVDPQQAQQAIQLSEQARTAGLSGGGGYAAGAQGVTGAGSAPT